MTLAIDYDPAYDDLDNEATKDLLTGIVQEVCTCLAVLYSYM